MLKQLPKNNLSIAKKKKKKKTQAQLIGFAYQLNTNLIYNEIHQSC